MSKKSIAILLLPGLILSLSCGLQKKPAPWTPALDENTAYVLTKPITEVKQHLDAAQQFQKKGQKAKADAEMKLVRQGLENLESYYLPLLNAKAHISAAYQLTRRKELARAEEELKKARSQIIIAKTKVSGALLKEISGLTLDLESLEKELKKVADNSQARFIKIAGQLENLLNRAI